MNVTNAVQRDPNINSAVYICIPSTDSADAEYALDCGAALQPEFILACLGTFDNEALEVTVYEAHDSYYGWTFLCNIPRLDATVGTPIPVKIHRTKRYIKIVIKNIGQDTATFTFILIK